MDSGISTLQGIVNEKVFEVPEYQRFYSWEEDHLEDLWTDIQNLTDEKKHYFGTVILQETDEAAETQGRFPKTLDKLHLIDGQQRLTTVAILFRVLTEEMLAALEELADKQEREQLEDRAKDIERDFLNEGGAYKIELLGDDREFFKKHIIEGQDYPRDEITPSQERLYRAKKYFAQKIEVLRSDSQDTVDFLQRCDTICQRVSSMQIMVYVVKTEDPGRATLIFESVNDRGRNLGDLEKTKSFLMHLLYLATEDEEEALERRLTKVRGNFRDIYRHLQTISQSARTTRVEEDDIQRYHYISFAEWTDKEQYQNPLDDLKEQMRATYRSNPEKSVKEILDYARSLEQAFQSMREIATYPKGAKGGHPDLERYLRRVYLLGNVANFYPVLVQAWQNPDITDDGRVEILRAMERYIVRVYAVGRRRSDTGLAKLARKTRDRAGKELDGAAWADLIYSVLQDYGDDAKFEESLQSPSLCERLTAKELKYLLAFYNAHLGAEADEPGASNPLDLVEGKGFWIEHIWPQNPRESMTAEEELEHKKYVDRLGNLTLSSDTHDQRWGNQPFDEKRNDYGESALRVQRELVTFEEWGPEQIETREARIRAWAVDHWNLPDQPGSSEGDDEATSS